MSDYILPCHDESYLVIMDFTNVAKRFLLLIDKHFHKNHRYHKLFNPNTVKCSYSCMSSMKAIINGHNAKVLADGPQTNTRQCNCRTPGNCPLDGHCLTESVVYKATVSGPRVVTRHYYGLTEGPFKRRYYAHAMSFIDERHKHDTELSKHIWRLKDEQKAYNVEWNIVKHAKPYKCGSRRCDVCLTEKTVIATADPNTMLNKRSELVSACRHQAKFRFKNLSHDPT